MSILYVIVVAAILIIGITVVMSRYDHAVNFRQCNWIEFKHNVLQNSNLKNDAYTSLLEEYMENQPSIWELFLSRKRYIPENFYTQKQIDTYFTPFI